MFVRSLLGKFKLPTTSVVNINVCQFHNSKCVQGIEDFIEIKKANEAFTSGRAWTPSDLRKKV